MVTLHLTLISSQKFLVIIHLVSLGVGRTYYRFSSPNELYSVFDKTEIAQRVALMPCLFAFIRAKNFSQAFDLVNYINDIPGNPVKNRRKHVVISTPRIDKTLMTNKTIHFDVNFISPSRIGIEAITKRRIQNDNIEAMLQKVNKW